MVIFSLKKIGVDLDLDISKDETDLIEKNIPVELIYGSIFDIIIKKSIIIDTIAGVSSMNFLNMIIILYKVNKKINI